MGSPSIESMVKGPSPLSRLLGDGVRPIKIVQFPGERGEAYKLQVGIYNLFDSETRSARIDAMEYLSTKLKLTEMHLARDPSLGEEEVKSQLLFRALRDAANPVMPFATDVQQLRDRITPDEREALFAAYLEFVDERSPMKHIKSSTEVDELISALSKPSLGERSLTSYDSASLRSIVMSLVDRCVKLTKQLSSDSSPVSDSPLSLMSAATDGS